MSKPAAATETQPGFCTSCFDLTLLYGFRNRAHGLFNEVRIDQFEFILQFVLSAGDSNTDQIARQRTLGDCLELIVSRLTLPPNAENLIAGLQPTELSRTIGDKAADLNRLCRGIRDRYA